MTIQTLYRVQCGGACERYLSSDLWAGTRPPMIDTIDAALFLTFSSAYDGAVRRGWSQFPLLCPDCARELREGITRVEVCTQADPPEDSGNIPEGDQGPE